MSEETKFGVVDQESADGGDQSPGHGSGSDPADDPDKGPLGRLWAWFTSPSGAKGWLVRGVIVFIALALITAPFGGEGPSDDPAGETDDGTDSAQQDGATDAPSTNDGTTDGDTTDGGTEDSADPPTPPQASFTSSCDNLACTFDASGSEPGDTAISNYEWRFGDGRFATGESQTHTYDAGGTYSVELTVTDENDETDTTTQEIDVTPPEGPSARLSANCTDLACSFDGTSSQAGEANITTYDWEFGDGTTTTGETADHTYDAAGTYTVSLTVTDANDQQDTTTQDVQVTAPPPDPITFTGTGDDVTDTFTTEQKLLKVEFSHDGDSNFIVDLLTEDGEKEELFANEIGPYDASRYFNPPPENYLLDIQADGNWEITIHQSRPDSGEETPVGWTGQGDTASDVMDLQEGLHTFEFSHDGDSNFIVELYDENGDSIALLANEIGSYEGSTAERIPQDGFYVLDIVADGSWTIDVTD
jgi:PKD repeat protein